MYPPKDNSKLGKIRVSFMKFYPDLYLFWLDN
jgi:hypothetical protein